MLYSWIFFLSIFSWYVPYMNWLFVRVWHKISLLLLKMLSFSPLLLFFLPWFEYLGLGIVSSLPFLIYFSLAASFRFHFTSNSLFDFCCVILRFPLICFLLQLRKQSFVRKSSEGGELLTSTQKHLWWKKGESKNGKIFFWFFITFGCIDHPQNSDFWPNLLWIFDICKIQLTLICRK